MFIKILWPYKGCDIRVGDIKEIKVHRTISSMSIKDLILYKAYSFFLEENERTL